MDVRPTGLHMRTMVHAVAPPSSVRPSAPSGPVSRGLGIAALLGVLGAGALLVLAAAAAPSFAVTAGWRAWPHWLAGPFSGIGLELGVRPWRLVFAAMFASYVVVLLCRRAIPARLAIGAIVVLHVLFLLAPPLLSSDVFFYMENARLGVVHGLNPYVYGPGAAPLDEIRTYANLSPVQNPYGPLFTAATYGLVPLGLPANLWALKVATAVASLGIVGLVWRSAQQMGRNPLPRAMLVGLNPVLLVYAVGGAHNDIFMMLLLIGGVSFVLAGRHVAAGAAIAAATAVKLSGGVVLPFILLGRRDGKRLLASAAAVGTLIVLATLPLFGLHVLDFVLGAVEVADQVSSSSATSRIGHALGLGGATRGLRAGAGLTLVASLAVLLTRTYRGGDWLSATAWAMLAVLLTASWVLGWYVLWLLPLAALTTSRALHLLTVGVTAPFVIWPGITA